jgi:hypothetical protein
MNPAPIASEDRAAYWRERRRAYHKVYHRTPIGRLINHLGVARWAYRKRPSPAIAARIARLEAEIETLKGGRRGDL